MGPIVLAAVVVVGAAVKYMNDSDAASAQGIVGKANAYASNTTRKANNELSAKQSNLANYMRSYSNNQILKTYGSQFNAVSENLARTMDDATSNSVERRLQGSEQLGSLAATAASIGVGGQTVDSINTTMRLRDATVEETYANKEKQNNYDYLAQKNGMLSTAVNSFDNSITSPGIDRSTTIAPYVAKPSLAGAVIGALGNSYTQSAISTGLQMFANTSTPATTNAPALAPQASGTTGNPYGSPYLSGFAPKTTGSNINI